MSENDVVNRSSIPSTSDKVVYVTPEVTTYTAAELHELLGLGEAYGASMFSQHVSFFLAMKP